MNLLEKAMTKKEGDLPPLAIAQELLKTKWRIYLMSKNPLQLNKPVFLWISMDDVLHKIGSDPLRNAMLLLIDSLLKSDKLHFQTKFQPGLTTETLFNFKNLPHQKEELFPFSVGQTTFDCTQKFSQSDLSCVSKFFCDSHLPFLTQNRAFGYLFDIWDGLKIDPKMKACLETFGEQFPNVIKATWALAQLPTSELSFKETIVRELDNCLEDSGVTKYLGDEDSSLPASILGSLLDSSSVKLSTQVQLRPSLSMLHQGEHIDWRQAVCLKIEQPDLFYDPVKHSPAVFVPKSTTWKDIEDHPLSKHVRDQPHIFASLIFYSSRIFPNDPIQSVVTLDKNNFEVRFLNGYAVSFLHDQLIPLVLRKADFDQLPIMIKEYYNL